MVGGHCGCAGSTDVIMLRIMVSTAMNEGSFSYPLHRVRSFLLKNSHSSISKTVGPGLDSTSDFSLQVVLLPGLLIVDSCGGEVRGFL